MWDPSSFPSSAPSRPAICEILCTSLINTILDFCFGLTNAKKHFSQQSGPRHSPWKTKTHGFALFTLKMEDDKAGPSNPVISQSANVVVQRLDSEFPTWNLTASVGDREAGSEIENQVTYILNDQISVLTPEQLRKIGVALQAKPSKPKTLSEGFETNETSQFNIVDVEQDEEEYLGEVLPDEIPDGSSVDPSDSGEVLEAIPGTEKDPQIIDRCRE
ncbi:hypothetical protein BSL78_27573 [Apostichopus japonicus]|uniref:Uncharacterized protein n=1 Tax=Stichopus japonicus TaxID=307972 RepID=A0A2G8JIP5_STIJA|nr:hypothetical protein BSL78_27573 [Apostichopus japonicus]